MAGAQLCPYRSLEIQPGASQAEVRRAYERVRGIFGPSSLAVYSLVDPEEQRQMLHEIEDAYRILSVPATRAAYDRAQGHPAPEGEVVRPPPLPRDARPRSVNVQEIEIPFVDPEVLRIVKVGEMPPAGEAPALAEPVAAPAEPVAAPPEPTAAPPEPTAAPAEPFAAPPVPIAAPPVPVAAPAEPVAASAEPVAAPAEPTWEMPAIGPDTAFTGELLRSVRLARGLNLREIATRTKISSTHLESIEQERWDWLPERVFLRGFLMSFAKELKLDPAQVSRSFLARRDAR